MIMDPVHNPYAPGAGSPPPELAGRDELRRVVRIALQRIRIGNPAKSVLMVGLRGVGKTVLLERIRVDTEADGMHTVRMEAPEGRSLPALLAPQLRVALLRLSRVEAAKDVAKRGLSALAGFAKALRITYQDIEVGLDFEPEPGLADNGDLEADLAPLLERVGIAAKAAGTATPASLSLSESQDNRQPRPNAVHGHACCATTPAVHLPLAHRRKQLQHQVIALQ